VQVEGADSGLSTISAETTKRVYSTPPFRPFPPPPPPQGERQVENEVIITSLTHKSGLP